MSKGQWRQTRERVVGQRQYCSSGTSVTIGRKIKRTKFISTVRVRLSSDSLTAPAVICSISSGEGSHFLRGLNAISFWFATVDDDCEKLGWKKQRRLHGCKLTITLIRSLTLKTVDTVEDGNHRSVMGCKLRLKRSRFNQPVSVLRGSYWRKLLYLMQKRRLHRIRK